ncbi:zinc-binding dehydrogenase [Actinomadura sp. 7K534]|uniref:zinc-binding dehydrogenase n=1 Tax=Actinomadura sp. 7K534 TaxID=2530366 RepID=UPI001043ED0D|nr:zinc-binding dehydrogenase [Actinomadura sp. 7K534]TDB93110.1 NADPH:quinone reductase [Actinomadura sp. 7K534]
MRAAVVSEFGGPEVFQVVERPDPEPGAGEVLVGVEVIDTLWLETMVRSGAGQDFWPMRPPYVPGNGVAGRVVQVGPGVDPGLRGQRVVAHTGGEGGYADRAVVPVAAMAVVPDDVDLTVAAGLLHDGVTALALFDVTKVGPRDRVLVVGASGGLGLLCVQLARARAASVVAVARGAKLERVAQLEPDAVIDSARPDWAEQARAVFGEHGADVVLDNVGGSLGETAFTLAARGGRFSAHGTPSGRFASIDRRTADERGVAVTGIEAVQLSDRDRMRYVGQALREAAAGVIAPVIGQTFPLEDAGAAHSVIEGRTAFGKTLLTAGA